ncbi:MAG: YihY/virulence factor BrkB family protein [Lachnospiraceae bacterium]|nr:YihY/virulence factor BrkB family protein [Lachnospiraceae bacterium]
MKKYSKQEVKDFATFFASGMTYKDVASYASSMAFFFFIALIPLLIILSKLLPLTGISDDQLIRVVTRVTPEIVDVMVVIIVKQAYSSTTGIISISAVVILYATARGMLALLRGLNRIFDVKVRHGGISVIIRAGIYTLLMLLYLILLLLIIVYGESIMIFLVSHIKVLDRVPLLFNFRYLLMMALGVISLMAVYAYVPSERQPFKKQLPGAVFTTVAWVVFSFFFSLFIGSSIYGTYYGSLAAVVIFMMWLYGCFYILLMGANLNLSVVSSPMRKSEEP